MALTHYRLLVWDKEGTQRFVLAMNDEIAGIERAEWTPEGDCIEAEFSGLASALNLAWRDVVQIDVSENSGSTWEPWFLGTVVRPGNTSSSKLSRFKLAGMKKRLYETICRTTLIAGADVAVMVSNLLGSYGGVTLPARTFFYNDAAPAQTFQLGNRNTSMQYLGDIMDEFTAAVPGFVVPAAETYDYDGTTYTATQTVPPTRWGVAPDGAIFFDRHRTATIARTEGTAGVTVEWKDADAEEVVDRVSIVLGRGPSEGVTANVQREWLGGTEFQYMPAPVEHTYVRDAGLAVAGLAEKIVEPEFDLAHWTKYTMTVNNFNDFDSWVQVIDNNIASGGAIATAAASTSNPKYVQLTEISTVIPYLFRIIWAIDADEYFNWQFVVTRYLSSGSGTFIRFTLPLADTGGTRREEWLLLPDGAGYEWPNATTIIRVESTADTFPDTWEPAMRIIEVEAYSKDEDALDRLAKTHIVTPSATPAVVRQVDVLPVNPATTMTFTPSGGGPTNYSIVGTRGSISKDHGVMTEYLLEQRLDADEAAQVALLNRRLELERIKTLRVVLAERTIS